MIHQSIQVRSAVRRPKDEPRRTLEVFTLVIHVQRPPVLTIPKGLSPVGEKPVPNAPISEDVHGLLSPSACVEPADGVMKPLVAFGAM